MRFRLERSPFDVQYMMFSSPLFEEQCFVTRQHMESLRQKINIYGKFSESNVIRGKAQSSLNLRMVNWRSCIIAGYDKKI